MSDFLEGFAWGAEDSVDSVLNKKKFGLRKIGSLDDLSDFIRLSNDTLISKAEKDLWRVEEDEDGGLTIYRLFDSTDSPLKV